MTALQTKEEYQDSLKEAAVKMAREHLYQGRPIDLLQHDLEVAFPALTSAALTACRKQAMRAWARKTKKWDNERLDVFGRNVAWLEYCYHVAITQGNVAAATKVISELNSMYGFDKKAGKNAAPVTNILNQSPTFIGNYSLDELNQAGRLTMHNNPPLLGEEVQDAEFEHA